MSATGSSLAKRQAFSDYVARCDFFDRQGMLDVEKFTVHLYLCLYCDGAPAPAPVSLYEQLLKAIAAARGKIETGQVYKETVENWKDSLKNYYPDKERTLVHFDVMAVVYPDWIKRVGTELMGVGSTESDKGRFWLTAEWQLTSRYLQRFEAELVRAGGLSKVVAPEGTRFN